MRWIYCPDCGVPRCFWRRAWPRTLRGLLLAEPCPACGSRRKGRGPGTLVGMAMIVIVCLATGLTVLWLLLRLWGNA